MAKTIAQVQAEWTTHGNVSRIQCALELEMNDARRAGLEALLKEQLAIVALYEV